MVENQYAGINNIAIHIILRQNQFNDSEKDKRTRVKPAKQSEKKGRKKERRKKERKMIYNNIIMNNREWIGINGIVSVCHLSTKEIYSYIVVVCFDWRITRKIYTCKCCVHTIQWRIVGFSVACSHSIHRLFYRMVNII